MLPEDALPGLGLVGLDSRCLAERLARIASEDPVGPRRTPGELLADPVDLATFLLGRDHRDVRTLAGLLERPETDRTPAVALALWEALARDSPKTPDPRVADRLFQLVAAGEREGTRHFAAECLARAAPERFFELPQGAPQIDRAVANALASLIHRRDPRALERARWSALHGSWPDVQRPALLALDALAEPTRRQILSEIVISNRGTPSGTLASALLNQDPIEGGSTREGFVESPAPATPSAAVHISPEACRERRGP
ncbi:MAG: hypothetical protein L0216_21410 [Planctomycetales bacterium]|nr:hypothetical protein [Planctomycetales bacterium]